MNRRFSINFAILSMILDVIVVISSLWLSSIIRPALNSISFIKPIPAPVVIPNALFIIFPFIWILIYLLMSIYDGKKNMRVVDEFGALTLGVVIASVSAAGVLYLSYREFSRAIFILFVPITYILSLSWRIVARSLIRSHRTLPASEKRVLIVGSGPMAHKIETRLKEDSPWQLTLLGFIDEKKDSHTSQPLMGDTGELRNLAIKHHASDVIIALPYSAYSQLGNIVQQLEDLSINVWVALGFFDLALYKTAIEDFAGIPMIDLRASAIDDYQLMVKRAFDLVLGSVGLLLALPAFLFISIAILFEDGRPIFFSQKRAGENGCEFNILKFRTMIRGAENLRSMVEKTDENGNSIQKHKDDPRVTRVGKILRRFSLDEIPQIINVLKGEMSLVGPRPELPELVEKYQPWQRKRFAIPQGMTGWWQIHGRSDKPMYLHTEDDLYYIQHYSIWLDLFILINTFWVVIRGKGAY